MENTIDNESLEFEKIKMIYEKNAEHHKYYLTWRQILLAGYFTIIGILFYSIYTLVERNDLIYFIIACGLSILIFYLSRLFIQLDGRNSDLYHVCQNVGEKIERELLHLEDSDVSNKALFLTLSKSYKNSKYKTHTEVIKTIYKWTGYFGIISVILIVLKYILDKFLSI